MTTRMTERLEQLLKFFEADPQDAFCSYGIALEYAKSGRPDEAIRWLDQTLQIDPNYCYAFYQKSKILADTGDITAARRVLEDGMAVAQRVADEHAYSEMAELNESLTGPV